MINAPTQVMINELIKNHTDEEGVFLIKKEAFQVVAQIIWNEAHYQGYTKGMEHGWEDAKKLEKESSHA